MGYEHPQGLQHVRRKVRGVGGVDASSPSGGGSPSVLRMRRPRKHSSPTATRKIRIKLNARYPPSRTGLVLQFGDAKVSPSVRQINYGRWMVKEMIALIQLKKVRLRRCPILTNLECSL